MEKAEAITLDEARELVGDAALWPRMRDFLWDFAPSIHVSWLEEKFGSLEVWKFGGEEKHPSNPLTIQSSPRVKRFILESLGVEPFFHDFPKDDWSRLALLDGATLLEIAKWLGALACAESLRRVTDGAAVRGLKTALPGVYPEVFAYTAYFRGVAAKEAKGAEDVVAAGMAALSGCLSALKPELLRRFQLKLPKELCGLCEPGGEKTVSDDALSKLLKLKFPEAYRLCC